MQNSIWKLTALAGVIGLGFLIVLQMQGEIDQNQQARQEPSASPDTETVLTEPVPNADNQATAPTGLALTEPPPVDQWEPDTGNDTTSDLPEFPPATGTESFRSSDPFSEPPPLLADSAPAAPADLNLPESAPLLAGTDEFDSTPAPLAPLDEPAPFQLMSSEELAPPAEPSADPAAARPEPLPGLPTSELPAVDTNPPLELPEVPVTEPLPELNLPEAESPAGLFDSLPEAEETPIEVAAPPLQDLPADAGAPSLPAATDLPDSIPEAGPLPGLPEVTDETYLVEPEPLSDSELNTLSEPPPLLTEEPLLPEPNVPSGEPAELIEEPASLTSEPVAAPAAEPPALPATPTEAPVLSRSTGEVITELTGDAELPAQNLPASALQPQLTIEKVAPKEATLGKPMIYSIIVSNRGDTNAAQVIVEDRVPKGCRLVGTIPQAELIGSKLLWRLGHLAAGSKKKILVKVIPVEEGQVGSIATVNFVAEVAAQTDVQAAALNQPAGTGTRLPTDASPSLNSESSGESAAAMPTEPRASETPAIALSVSGPDQAQVGDTVVLKFNIANKGTAPARNVALQDIIPAGFEHPAGNDLTYEVGHLPPGKSVDVELELVAVEPGTHTNQAVITAAGNVRTESKKKVEIVDARGLTVKVDPLAARPIGDTVTLQVHVTNESPQPVSSATLTAPLPAGIHFVSATGGGLFDQTSRTLTWSLPPLAAGTTTSVSVRITPLEVGTRTIPVALIQPGRDPQTVDSSVSAVGIAALKLDLDNVPATAASGEEFTADITVTNRGNGPDRSVQLALNLPTGVDFVSARGPVRHETPQPDASDRRVTFATIPEIGDQASVEFRITLRARTPGRHRLRAQISSEQLGSPLATDADIVVLGSAS